VIGTLDHNKASAARRRCVRLQAASQRRHLTSAFKRRADADGANSEREIPEAFTIHRDSPTWNQVHQPA
jgi:hypothetical protein